MSCGTDRGVRAHKGRNEPPCKFCRKFMDNPAPAPGVVVLAPVPVAVRRKPDRDVAARRERPAKAVVGPRVSKQFSVTRPPVVCGTERGFVKHKRQPEPACGPCQEAHETSLEKGRVERAAAKVAGMAEAMATAADRFPDPVPRAPRPVRTPKAPRELQPCGTPAGRARHLKRKEPVCEPCRLAYNADARELHAKRTKPMDRSHIVCGTVEGYGRHTWLKTPPCRPCLGAKAAASRASYVRKTEPLPPAECGTTRGYRKHTTDKTPYCQPCRNAYNQRRAERRIEQKAEAA